MKRVLITRPEPGATETAAHLSVRGFTPVVAPVLFIQFGKPIPPRRIAATVLTSRNAIPACPHSLHDRPVFTVGAATAAAATQAGFLRVLSADGDAVLLGKLIADTLSPQAGALFLPTGEGQGTDLTVSLRQQGFRVVRRVAYRAIGVDHLPPTALTLLRDHRLASAMFFSGDTSRHFVHLLRAARLVDAVTTVEAVSISERAAVALRDLRWRRIKIAAKPNQDEMLALLEHD